MPSYSISLSVAGPLMATGMQSSAFGIDSPFLRDADGKRYVLPGTQLRGVLRQILTVMSEAAPDRLDPRMLELLFGQASGRASERKFDRDPTGWEPKTGLISISDLAASFDAPAKPLSITRIAVDDFSGSVREGHLQVLEQPVRINDTLVFEGTITLRTDPATAEVYIDWIAKALKLVAAIGANKSAGFGRVIAAPRPKPLPEAPAAFAVDAALAREFSEAGGVDITLVFDGPFLISAERWNSNLISGQSRIPGSALKAVIAGMIGAATESHPLHDIVAKAVFRELRPAKGDAGRPKTAPLCFFAVDNEATIWNAFEDDPEDYLAEGAAKSVAFLPDIKSDSTFMVELRAKLGETFELERQVRTRTAVNGKGVAETAQLFTYSAIRPNGFVWKGRLVRGDATQEEFATLLSALPARIHGFGKTRVGAELKLAAAAPEKKPPPTKRVVVVLETAACLHAPEDLDRNLDIIDPAERLRRHYQSYFAEALRSMAGLDAKVFDDEALGLRLFASQTRIGGYLAIRYPVSDDGYLPWILTTPGSAFALNVPLGTEAALTHMLENGLPVSHGFAGKRRTWRGNPFVPENGFGEIRLLGEV